jgi:putative CocE/NonD family hydrolase
MTSAVFFELRNMRLMVRMFCLACILLAATETELAEEHDMTVEVAVAAKMRDGVLLRADIYRPKTTEKLPVLLLRTPYNQGAPVSIKMGLTAAAHGYVVIIQDVRGRFSSDGDWYPFKYESQDGYDTVEWAAALPYVNGKIGMIASSYGGVTQLLAAMAHPPHLTALFPAMTPSNCYDGWVYQGGAFEQWFNQTWTSESLALDSLLRRVRKNTDVLQWSSRLPLAEFPVLEVGNDKALAPYYLDWLAHPSYDDYWKQWSIEEKFEDIKVPIYSVAGWYDIFLGGGLSNYTGMRARGGSEIARRGTRLLVVPGGHAGSGQKIGEVDFGSGSLVDIESIMFRWYDYVLKGNSNGIEREKPVKIFVMGENIWREEDDWPLSRAQAIRFYLHSDGAANSSSGNGALNMVRPSEEPSDQFIYNPADPVPTRGGNLCCGASVPGGPLDQRPVETRADVLVYSTPPFTKKLEVTGPVSLELYGSSSAVDTDFTAKLIDVWPNGFAQNLTDSILRARYRNSKETSELLEPGKIYRLTIDMVATSNVFLAGHRLRLEISSSNFPRFDRNLNTGENPGNATLFKKATNMVHHDRQHPSALIVPVVTQ